MSRYVEAMLLVALTGLAQAHVPHEIVTSIAAPSDLSGGSWFLLLAVLGPHLLRSEDEGRTWTMIGGAPTGDNLLELARLEPGVLVARSEERLWWSEDEGASWQVRDLPARIVDMQGGSTLTLVGDGVWTGSPDALTLALEGDFASVGQGGVLITLEGEVLVQEAGSWQTAARLPGARLALRDGDTLYAADANRALLRLDEDWTPCGLPEGEGVVSLWATGGGALLAGGVELAPYVSVDRCASWTLSELPDRVSYDTEGGAITPQEAYPVLMGEGDRWLVGGWFGYWHSEDAGQSWQDSRLFPPDFIRGLAFGDDGRVYKGGYAYGVAYSGDDGASFDAQNVGVNLPNIQDIFTRGDRVYALANHDGWTSYDGGESWLRWAVNDQLDFIIWFRVLPNDWLWIRTDDELSLSTDGGNYLRPCESLPATAGEIQLFDARGSADDIEMCVQVDQALHCSTDLTASWSVWYTGPDTLGALFAGEDAFWVSDSAGIHRVTSDGVEDFPLPEGVVPTVIAVASEGTIFFSTRDASLYRMRPEDADWSRVGQLNAPIDQLDLPPDFEERPRLLLATHDGVFALDDALDDAPALARWRPWERVDTTTDFALWRPGRPDSLWEAEADFSVVQPLEVDASVQVWVRGTTLRVRGGSRGDAEALLTVDGEAMATLGAEPAEGVSTLWSGSGFAPGWHLVELVGVREGLLLDSVEGAEPTEPDDDTGATAPPKGGRCGGCEGGRAMAPLLALGALRARRRRA